MTASTDLPARTQRERSEATITLLVSVARDVFAREGYAATSLNTVVEIAGVTKGALYHHFEGKRELFQAVYETEWIRLAAVVNRAARGEADAWLAFQTGVESFLKALLDPGVQRILLMDAPGVLGAEAVYLQQTTGAGSFAQIRRGLERCIETGAITPRPVEPLTHLIFGAVCASATLVTRSDDPRGALVDVRAHLRTMLDALVGRDTANRDTAQGAAGQDTAPAG